MNSQNNVTILTTTRSLLIAGVLMGSAMSSAWASPPIRIDHLPSGLQKVGDFFFRIARSLEQGGYPDDEHDYSIIYDARSRDPIRVEVTPRQDRYTVVPPGSRPSSDIAPYPPQPRSRIWIDPQTGQRVDSPRFQPQPQPQIRPDARRQDQQEDLNVPLDPQSDGSINRSQTVEPRRSPNSSGPGGPFEPPPSVSKKPQTQDNTAHEGKAAPQSSSSSQLGFATPVPGKPGFVYPPGVEQDTKNMLDVRDFAPGQKVKDPRTGKLFLVPPK
jgi:hypothetical protein